MPDISLEERGRRASRVTGAVAIILDERGRVLLVKHNYGLLNWEIPGGVAEPDESPTETAERETFEETGLVVRATRQTGIYYDRQTHHPGHPLVEVLHFTFNCELLDPAAKPQPGLDEISECGYWPPDALPRPMTDFTERRIRDALSPTPPALPVSVGPRVLLD